MSSRIQSVLPNFRCAAWRASSADIPLAMLSSVSICRYDLSSSARSRSHRALRKNRRQPMCLLRDWLQNASDGPNHLLPTLRMRDQLLSASGSQAVILRFTIVLRSAPEGRDPAAIFESMQRGIERSMFDLQNIFRTALDRMCDRVTMSRAEH